MRRQSPSMEENGTTLVIHASVSNEGKLDVWTQSNPAISFEDVTVAMRKVRDELNRVLEQGPAVCPFRNHRGT